LFEKGLLVDKDILDLFNGEDINSVKFFIEKIKNTTNQTLITKHTLEQNKEKVNNLILNFPKRIQLILRN
jgi:hypothetical protein